MGNRKKQLCRYHIVVTCVVIRRGQEVLILKRSKKEKEGPGLWTIPGGKVKSVDWAPMKPCGLSHKLWRGALKNACARELKEETGLAARRFCFCAGAEVIFIRRTGAPTMVFRFFANKARWRSVRLGKDNVEFQWVKPRELNRYHFIGNVKQDIFAILKEAAKRS